jgi:hypothetical protein
MFKKLKSYFSSKNDSKSIEEQLSDKQKATAKGEPYVKVLSVQIDEKNPGEGYFELDWNKPFVEKLRQAGYTGTNEEEIIDVWFTSLCRNIGDDLG